MSKIKVNEGDLKQFASIIGDVEDKCGEALRHLNVDLNSLLANIPGVSTSRIQDIEASYKKVIHKYREKLDHAQLLVKKTEAAMRQAEKNLGAKAGEFGLEMLGYYDVQRIFSEYDPITGEKVSVGDRLLASGMLALSLFPPAKVVGVGGKVAVKGVNAAAKAGSKFGFESFAKNLPAFNSLKNVLNTKKVLEVFDGIYKKVIKAPLAATKLWLDRTVRQIADFRLPVIGPQLASAMGAVPSKTVGEAFGEAKDLFVKMVGEKPDNRAVWKDAKGTGKVYPTRQIDPVSELHIIDRVKELRGNLTSKYKKSGNFALAEVDVSGLSKKEFYALSKIDEFKANLEEIVPDISLKPNEPIFKASLAPDKDGKPYLRDSDTEYKILNEIASKLGGDVNAVGKIKLFTELDTCDSCSKVIAEFATKYKNIELEVIHNNGERLKP
ncbi:deaminase domain-containing protein [Neobacillus sp. LXY-4]|uniref:deaminase domain-containing protein n=1 Tax=Neobacillus sp. LXY-4 TaxID=3379826 RepID=UPI003F4A24C2